MPERSETALRLLCWGLGAVLLVQVAIKIVAPNPLSGLKIPALPTVSDPAESGSGGKGTNASAGNSAAGHATPNGTNVTVVKGAGGTGTNLASRDAGSNNTVVASTNLAAARGTNLLAEADAAGSPSNAVAAPVAPKPETNSAAELQGAHSGTNAIARHDSGKSATNAVSDHKPAGTGNEMAMKGGNGPMRRGGPGNRPPELPLPIQARVDRVVDSELFGPVFHPMPSGLLGIAGNMAFLRASNGQTGAVKEGDALGGLKLLRIGINRVLVEEEGQKKELMIFEGLGGQSLLAN